MFLSAYYTQADHTAQPPFLKAVRGRGAYPVDQIP